MSTDDVGLDWADPRRSVLADGPHEDEAEAFDQLAPLCGEQRRRRLKVGPVEHGILQVAWYTRRGHRPQRTQFLDEKQDDDAYPGSAARSSRPCFNPQPPTKV